MMLANPRFAFDRSVRTTDHDGRLHVAVATISAATVSGYLGSELVDADAFGLDPNRIYQVLRPADELAKAVPTFNNIPVLSRHMPVSASDHRPDLVVGSTGTDAAFDPPYLRNSLVVWEAAAIAAIEDGSQRSLSAAYRYRLDQKAGAFEGQPYSFVMRDIIGNHVALVSEPRVTGAMIGDERNPGMDDVIDSRDDWATQLFKFLGGKLSPTDLAKVEEIVHRALGTVAEDRVWSPGLYPYEQRQAQDAAVRRAVNAPAARSAFARRFPDAPRVKHL